MKQRNSHLEIMASNQTRKCPLVSTSSSTRPFSCGLRGPELCPILSFCGRLVLKTNFWWQEIKSTAFHLYLDASFIEYLTSEKRSGAPAKNSEKIRECVGQAEVTPPTESRVTAFQISQNISQSRKKSPSELTGKGKLICQGEVPIGDNYRR